MAEKKKTGAEPKNIETHDMDENAFVDLSSTEMTELHLGDRVWHVPVKLSYGMMASIVSDAALLALSVDKKTGAVKRDTVMEEPCLIYSLLRRYGDLELADDEDVYALYDAFQDSPDAAYRDTFWAKIFPLHIENMKQRLRYLQEQNSCAALLKSMMTEIVGDREGNDPGMIRSMLTAVVMKMAEDQRYSGGAGKVVDLSAFRKKDE